MSKKAAYHLSRSIISCLLLILVSCSEITNQHNETLESLAVTELIDGEGTLQAGTGTGYVYFGPTNNSSICTDNNTQCLFTTKYNTDSLYDGGKQYMVQVESKDSGGNPISVAGKVELSTTAKRRGSRSLKFDIAASNVPNGINRAEFRYFYPGGALLPHGNDRYTGFSVMFPTGFSTPTDWFLFHQVWQQIAPPVALEVASGSTSSTTAPIELRVKARNNQNNSANGPNELHWPVNQSWANGASTITLTRNQWYDFVLHWRSNPDNGNGVLELWLDGVLIVSYTGNLGYSGTIPGLNGTTITINENGTLEKLGIYRGSTNPAQSIFYDEIRTGTALFEVIPSPNYTQVFTNLNNWVTSGTGASWSINGGRLLQANGGAGTATSLVHAYYNNATAATWNKYRVYGEFQRRNNDDDPMGLVFYRTGSGYYIFYQSNEPGWVGCYLDKWNGTARVGIASTTATACSNIGANQMFTMSVTAKNGQIIGVINGKQVLSVNDSSFTQGTVGVYSHQNEGFADNIVVSLIQ